MKITYWQFTVVVDMDQYLVQVKTCALRIMRDQITAPPQILVTPTMLHMDILTATATQRPFLQEAMDSFHQQSKSYI